MKTFLFILLCLFSIEPVLSKDSNVLRFGVDPSFPPFESKQPDGQLQGLDIEIGQAICAQMQRQCKWIEQDFDGLIVALKARKFDAILSALSITAHRQKQIDFSIPLYQMHSRMICHQHTSFSPTAASLKNKRVGVQQGTVQEAYAKHHWAPHGVHVIAYPYQTQVYADLVANRLDAALQDEIQAKLSFLKTQHGSQYHFCGPVLTDAETLGKGTAIGIRKNNMKLTEQINQALEILEKEGKLAKLIQKYLDR